MAMRVASLASGSSGNSYYIECPDGAVVIDAGLPGKTIERHLRLAGGDPARVRGVIVTHDHHDHASGAGVLQRRFGWRLWMTKGTYDGAARRLGKVRVDFVRPDSGVEVAGMRFAFLPTPHDGTEPMAVTVERNGRRCGVLTDLGHAFPGLAEVVNSLDFAFLESNYDPDILATNPRYPYPLKKRISGSHGHISNQDAAELVAGLSGDRLRCVVLSHLSQENNTPDLAQSTFSTLVERRIKEMGMKVGVAWRHQPMLLCTV